MGLWVLGLWVDDLSPRRHLAFSIVFRRSSQMLTRSSSSNSEHEELGVTGSSKKGQEHASWSVEDEAKLLAIFMEQRAFMTDNHMFKLPVFQDAATQLNQSRTRGAPKTVTSVRSKWGTVCHPFWYCDT